MSFSVILADPPWSFRDKGSRISPEAGHYDTLTIPELSNVAGAMVRSIAAPNAILFMWAPHAMVIDGTAALVIRAWAFEPKQELVWVKTTNDRERVRIGAGHYCRLATEPCLLCTRGRAAPLVKDHSIPNVIFAPRGKHSAKPDEMYQLIERMVPGGKFLELYARRQWSEKWTAWGDELDSSTQ